MITFIFTPLHLCFLFLLFSFMPAGGGIMELNENEKSLLLKIARRSLTACVKKEKMEAFKDIPQKFKEKSGAFVTLHKHGGLSGCIGHIMPYGTLYETVVDMAEAAALHDSRFTPVVPDELDDIDIEISVLTPPVEIPSLKEFVIGRHGIIINLHGRQAVFLPQVALEQKWNKDTTLRHLCMKAGLPADAYHNKEMKFRVFEAIVFGEKDKTH
jgi:AmmeMemoRadiSam system protein A